MRGTLPGLLLLAAINVYAQVPDSGAVKQPPTADSMQQTPADTAQVVEKQPTTWKGEKYTLFAGAQIGIGGAAIATENAEGRKTNPDFWFLPTYGAVITAPFSNGSRIRGRLDLGVWSTGTRTRPYEFYYGMKNWDGYFVERYTYFTIAPYINLSGILIGVGFDFPMKGEMWNPKSDADVHVVDKTTMKTGMDLRIGGSIPAWETDLGTLNIELVAYYMFSGVYEDGQYPYGLATINSRGDVPTNQNDLINASVKNLTPAGAHLGISYQFKIGL